MATKISDLTSVSSLDGSELIEVVQSGANKKCSVNQLRASTHGNVTPTAEFTRADTFEWARSGNVGQIIINNVACSTSGNIKIGQIDFHPSSITYFVGWDLANNMIQFVVNASGEIYIINNTTNLCYGSVTFIII